MEQAESKEKQLQPHTSARHSSVGKILTMAFVCFIASFFGAWVFVGSGIIPTNQSNKNIQRQLVLQEGEVVADVAQRVSPSVVSIITVSSSGQRNLFGNSLDEGAGTGVIVSKDGYIITNKHVVGEGTRRVDVVLNSGERIENVKIVGRDPLNDVAFLKIEGKNDLPAATLGDSNGVKVGQKVVAIGNALGQYQNTVTSGIISGVGRPVVAGDGQTAATERLEDLFQTDAAINPGNSGGPLVDLEGKVIGINTAIAEDAEGVGFSIPINATKGLLKGVLKDGKVSRAYIGLQYVSLTPEVARELKISAQKGAYVGSGDGTGGPIADGPADKAGIRKGDIITKVNDITVGQPIGLSGILAQFAPGDTVKLTYLRDGKEQTANVTLVEYRQ